MNFADSNDELIRDLHADGFFFFTLRNVVLQDDGCPGVGDQRSDGRPLSTANDQVSFPMAGCAARGDDGLNGLEPLMDHANAVLLELVTNRTISAAERERIVVPAHPKSLQDLLAPFAGNSRFHGLAMEHCEVFPGPDPVWDDYMTGNR